MTLPDNLYLKAWFDRYVSRFYPEHSGNQDPIRLKVEHTRQVCKNSLLIGHALDLPPDQIRLAESIALLHDVGRFEQYARFGTFDDRISVNHALMGLRVVFTNRVLTGFEYKHRRLIAKAIALHNVISLDHSTEENTLLHARLLRDADKLDIWRVFAEYFGDRSNSTRSRSDQTITLNLPDEDACALPIIDAMMSSCNASIQHAKTVNDYKLTLISWVFDLNFRPSFQILKKRGHLVRIAKTLPRRPEVQQAVGHVMDYIGRKD